MIIRSSLDPLNRAESTKDAAKQMVTPVATDKEARRSTMSSQAESANWSKPTGRWRQKNSVL